jgi:hypothetical protein
MVAMSTPRSAFLERANGDRAGQIIELNWDRVVIGRSPDCHIVLDAMGVSRRHAEIYRKGREYYLADLNSRNSTNVNFTKVIPGIDHRLSPGDLISICGLVFLFRPEPPDPDPDPIEPDDLTVVTAGEGQWVGRNLLDLSSELTIDAIAPKILDSLMELLPQAERLLLALVDPQTKQLVAKAFKYRPARRSSSSTSVPADQFPLSISRSVVDYVLGKKEFVMFRHLSADPRLPTSESIADLGIRSVMCAPLLTPGREALGIVHLTSDRTQFHQEDLELLAAVASQASIAIRNAQLQRKLAEASGLAGTIS